MVTLAILVLDPKDGGINAGGSSPTRQHRLTNQFSGEVEQYSCLFFH
jgi:hypothetical protein